MGVKREKVSDVPERLGDVPPEGMLAVAPGEALAVDGASQVEEEEDQQKEGRRKKESTVRSGPPARYYSRDRSEQELLEKLRSQTDGP